ncbi:MAG: PEGA domain-containing protein [Chloroflexi bacterium]|nr:PEGA domain-containing protein [Chloroflexota bacterium]
MPRYDAYAETQLIRGHTLTVYSNPRLGATVELDGRVRGRTPIIIRGVEKGPHTLRLTLEGFRPAVHTFERDGAAAARQPDAIRHARDGADPRVLVVPARDEEDALFVPHVDGEGDVHVREDDDVFDR